MGICRLGALAALPLLFASAPAHAVVSSPTPVFVENWENGTGRWRTTDGMPINVASDSGQACSTKYQHETTLATGGRAFTNNTAGGSSNIGVASSSTYCLTAWVRGSVGSQPYLGYTADTQTGSSTTNVIWLIGGGSSDSPVTQFTADGAWHWYKAEFTTGASTSFIDLVDENFDFGGPGATSDFDDIALYNASCAPLTPPPTHTACSGTTPICDTNASDVTLGQCRACSDSGQCTALGAGTNVCDTVIGDPNKGACVTCATSTDCSATAPVCSAYTCGACTASGQCSSYPNQTVCDPSGAKKGQCVQCASSTDCTAGAPVCDPTANTCGACTGDPDCAGYAGTKCDLTGDGNNGKCVRCTADADCATAGTICSNDACVPGCRGGGSPTACPAGQFCTSESATAGMCTTFCDFTNQCPAGTICLAPTTRDAGPTFCVQCGADNDCAAVTGKHVCSNTFVCTECSAVNTTACSASGNGAACLTDQTCGCNSDTDCGGSMSARICDGASHKCAVGCRGSGGNGCPAGMMCSSSNGSPGTCSATPPVVDMAMAPSDLAAPTGADMAMAGPDLAPGPADDMGPAPTPDMAHARTPGGTLGGGGCSCDVGNGDADTGAAMLFLLFGVAFVLRRRLGLRF